MKLKGLTIFIFICPSCAVSPSCTLVMDPCTAVHTNKVLTGSELWYGEIYPRNQAIRPEGPNPTNRTGELTAALVAIQQNQDSRPLKSTNNSTYTRCDVRHNMQKWLRNGVVDIAETEH